MYSIKSNTKNTINIKKSKFITYLYKVNSILEINDILNKMRNEHRTATHMCYAYIIDGKEKCSDDGEPSGTAGLPILNILKKNNLTNTLAIVVRYFGGIKLGAGGLVRAYSNSITDSLKLVEIIELTEGYLIELEFNYNNLKLVDYMLNSINIKNKIYSDNVIYNFYLNSEQLNFIPELEKIAIHVSIKDKVYIEKCKD